MSELARNEHGDEWTAHALRDDYVRNTTPKFAWWVCAFCDVEVTPAAVYGVKFEKRAYFTLASRTSPHANDCPYGDAGFVQYGVRATQPQAHRFNVDLPEKLVAPRPPRQAGVAGQGKPNGLASATEIRRRVNGLAATATIPNQYTTSLLQTLIDARKEAIKAIYGLKSISMLPAAKQTSAMFEVLKSVPLDLYGMATNYNSAFHKTTKMPWRGNFIYYGMADVAVISNGFLLTSHDRIPNADATLPPIAAYVVIQCDRANPVNRMEGRMITTLNEAAGAVAGKVAHAVSWSAYGQLVMNNTAGVYELTVTQPNHIAV
ncbi:MULTISPECIES: hypothetical protein [Paraburkholderia]|uniref:hypothetical protein n=1 Tax=Paraburkholderia TaxID=1822464 RepID=UPI0022572FB5|nr:MULTISPECIES: hypothetical protein [Paraburkholderia]MCX4163579.1 hypothetical protein [Paraburkholderia megapolitana]MDN7159074.1 hypothetical protein [Paraburkholderia sp. CHISQ3]MDQ6496121.1 hypothetical protein [Paraburkholderia megapolitana]